MEDIKIEEPVIFSQSSEQLFIMDRLGDIPKGKFIDIGAFHVEKFSNTRALYLHGWKGVMVEPAPSNWKAIADHYANDSEMVVLNVAIGEKNGEISFYDCNGDAIGTTDEGHKTRWEAGGVEYTKIKVQQMSVDDFFNQYGHGAAMLSLDTESTNLQIFRLIPDWAWEELQLVVVEHDGEMEEIQDKLSKFGFETLYTNAENILLARP